MLDIMCSYYILNEIVNKIYYFYFLIFINLLNELCLVINS